MDGIITAMSRTRRVSKNWSKRWIFIILASQGAICFAQGSPKAVEIVVPKAKCDVMATWQYRLALGPQLRSVTCDPKAQASHLVLDNGSSPEERFAYEFYAPNLQRGAEIFREALRPTQSPAGAGQARGVFEIVQNPTSLPSSPAEETTIFMVGEASCAQCQSEAGNLSSVVGVAARAGRKIRLVYLRFDELDRSATNPALKTLREAGAVMSTVRPTAIVRIGDRLLDAERSKVVLNALTPPPERINPIDELTDRDVLAAR